MKPSDEYECRLESCTNSFDRGVSTIITCGRFLAGIWALHLTLQLNSGITLQYIWGRAYIIINSNVAGTQGYGLLRRQRTALHGTTIHSAYALQQYVCSATAQPHRMLPAGCLQP